MSYVSYFYNEFWLLTVDCVLGYTQDFVRLLEDFPEFDNNDFSLKVASYLIELTHVESMAYDGNLNNTVSVFVA